MTPVRIQDARASRWWMLLAGLALALRLLVPQGYMPVANAAGGFPTLMPCPAQGPLPVGPAMATMHHGGGHGQHHAPTHDQSSDHSCPFAGFGAVLDMGSAPSILALPLVAAPIAALPEMLVGIGSGLASPPPPARGPPIRF